MAGRTKGKSRARRPAAKKAAKKAATATKAVPASIESRFDAARRDLKAAQVAFARVMAEAEGPGAIVVVSEEAALPVEGLLPTDAVSAGPPDGLTHHVALKSAPELRSKLDDPEVACELISARHSVALASRKVSEVRAQLADALAGENHRELQVLDRFGALLQQALDFDPQVRAR
ncbi:MAG: hypothetical protein KF709_02750 [Gemmatimonadaceae bacterium]|nr:hypothetical protein [Gemmatimonadaceae bacterium]